MTIPPTEGRNVRAAGLDLLSAPALVELLIAEQRNAVEAALEATDAIARAVEEVSERLSRGGTLHYVGAGSSGRIAVLDAAEMPPTFGTPRELVRAHIAGGMPALERAVEGAEDDADAGDVAMRANVKPSDAVVGISASGGAAFVVGAIERACKLGAYTVALTSVADSPLVRAAENPIVIASGSELLAGSTRLKAGTAQKIVLNAISTAVMVRLGKVYDNLMVDVVASNRKLRARALRLVQEIAGVDERRARDLLERADGRVKLAVVMERNRMDAAEAQALLDRHGGVLRALV
jgi:N-acetylmuramic acid 6-phosphate etherase